jgi:hypothetical protein
VLLDILEELNSALQLPSIDRLGSLTSILEARTQVRTSGPSTLRRVDLCSCVTNLEKIQLVAILKYEDVKFDGNGIKRRLNTETRSINRKNANNSPSCVRDGVVVV